LASDSGSADVSGNTSGGDATSGSASNIANIVNMIDSDISSGQSFVGIININGDLNGNILLPADFVNQMIADNVPEVNIETGTGPDSSNTINANNGNTTTVNNNNNEGITNDVTSTAASGDANVSDNTSAGDATSGSANTSITAFNLTGSNIIGSNDLLVFVNVVGGSWVGLILNAPAGSTAAEFGGGITSDTSANTTVNNDNNESITNNIDENAQSGNANVTDNTSGGNATSGNANNAVNELNVEDSNLSLSNWFGILFINVFGTWNGSVALYTPSSTGSAGTPTTGGSSSPVFSFKSKSSTAASGSGSSSMYPTYLSSYVANPSNTVGSSSNNSNAVLAASSNLKTPSTNSSSRFTTDKSSAPWMIIIGSIALYCLYLVWDRKHNFGTKTK